MHSPKTECPLCRKKEWEILFRLDEFNIVRCRPCGLIFRDVFLTADSSKDLYSERYFTDEQAGYFFNNPREKEELFNARMDTVQAYVPLKGTLLDIGCAIGTFLNIARGRGWNARGSEISEFAAGYARDKHGLDVVSGEFDKTKFGNEKFDVVTLWDVIDHSEDPVTFLNDAASLLKPGGYLFVLTTMEDSLIYEISKYLYKFSFGLIRGPVAKGHPIHHSTFFSKKTLKSAIESLGMRVRNIEPSKYPATFFPGGFLSKMVFGALSGIGDVAGKPLEVTFICQKR
ncbi:MAG: class I SAM-dependent methyltransferase [Candidatus Omnitrophica bacterium]|nr:class I SAM-dependent methyltransferase [Candidatus Omnitrophota bacterium]